MKGRKTIILSLISVLTGCFLIPFMALAENDQQIEEEGRQIEEDYAPGFYYTIKKGDTLWDLSRKFYDSEWRWPALWGQNKKLTNPHLIYPGQRIRLYQNVAPVKHDDMAAAEVEEVPTAAAQAVPAEEQAVAPVTPSTTPPETVYYLYPGISYVGFVQKLPKQGALGKPVDPLAMGVILKAAGEKKEMISQDDTVYIQPMEIQPSDNQAPEEETADASSDDSRIAASSTPIETTFIIGNRYSVYKPLTLVNDPITGDYAGHQYEIVGITEVTAIAPDYVTAKIVKSTDSIRAGYLIMPFEKRNKEVPLIPSPAGLTGEILMAEDDAEMSAETSIVFLNKGEQDGVQKGQRYDIYYQDTTRTDGKEMLLSPFVYGELLVLLTRATTATAVITESTDAVKSGNAFKSPL